MEQDELDMEMAPVTAGDMEGEVDEAPLSDEEEKAKNDNVLAKEKAELVDYWDNVLGMKKLLDDHTVQNAMFKVIDGNIASLRDQLETEEKSREVTLAQGKLAAYKQMRDFPASAVEQFNAKLFSVRTNLALFIEEDEWLQNVSVNYDTTNHRITIGGTETFPEIPEEPAVSEEDLDYETAEETADPY